MTYFDNILVDIPKAKRLPKRNNKTYVVEIFQRASKNCKKDDTAIVGVLASEGKMHPNMKYYERHPEIEKPVIKDASPSFSTCQSVGDYIFIKKIFEHLGLLTLLEEEFGSDAQLILAIVIYHLYTRDNSIQNFKYFVYDHYCGLNYIPSDTVLNNLFKQTMDNEKIKHFLGKRIKARLMINKKPEIIVDFDSSNINTASNNISYAENGKPKVEEDLPQVNFAYAVERETGIPLYLDVFYGSIVDMEHCKTAITKLTAFATKSKAEKIQQKLTFCFDRGYYVSSFINDIDEQYKFICMGKSSNFLNEIILKYPRNLIHQPVNKVADNFYGIKFRGKPFASIDKEMNIYLFYDPRANAGASKNEQDKIEKIANSIINKKDKNDGIMKTYGKKINITYKSKTKIIVSATPNMNYLSEVYSDSGYSFMISNEDFPIEEVYKIYKNRDIIEKDFKYSKSECGSNKFYAQSDESMMSRTFIAFICSIIRTTLHNDMKPYFLQYGSETTETVIRELGKIKVDKITDAFYPMCPLTNLQKQIFSFFELSKSDYDALISELNIIEQATCVNV